MTENIMSSKRDVLRLAKDGDVRFVRLVFADIFGVSKNVTIPISRLGAALDHKITFDGGSIDGFVRGEELDMMLRPDPSTFAIYPWQSADGAQARLICDIAMPDGTPFEGCPRTTLRRAAQAASTQCGDVTLGAELEFFLFTASTADPGSLTTSDVASYFDFPANDRGEEARLAIVAGLEAMGIGVWASHHEHAAGQHEIDLAPTSPLLTADAILTARTIAKHVAARFGLEATFMPKPLERAAGSGLHLDLHFQADSDTLSCGVGGILAHARALTAICNPTVNSYKRLVAEWDAPIYAVWSERSIDSFVRVAHGMNGGMFEVRSPDPSCNPYLAIAAILAAASHGISASTFAGEPIRDSSYALDARQRRDLGIITLPKSLRQALDALEDDPILRGALGDHIFAAFRDAKLAEYEQYRRSVHAWEHRAYLRLY